MFLHKQLDVTSLEMRLTREGGWRMVLRKDEVEIVNSGPRVSTFVYIMRRQ